MRAAEHIRDTHKYGVVLVLVLAQFVVLSAGGDSLAVRITAAVLGAAMLIAVYLTSGVAVHVRQIAIGVALAGVAAAFVSLSIGGSSAAGVSAVVSLLLVLTGAAGIARGIGVQPVIDRHTIAGALAIYLIIGLSYAYLYATIAAFAEPNFFAGDREDTIANFLYFSYVTQATLGYGDFVAATRLGRTFAVTEALLGQLYLVTVVAVLVSNVGREKRQRFVS